MPQISVIIPVYNGEKTIRETIESVLNQSFTDYEVIVINDGSQDATVDVLDQISDPRLRIFSYPNAGVSASRNRGIARATGQFIAFLDADDIWKPAKLASQLNALKVTPQADVAYSWIDFIDETGQYLWPGLHITENGNVLKKLLVTNFLECGSNPLIRRQALVEVGNFDSAVDTAEDWDMWLRLAVLHHFVAVPQPQILYRRASFTASTNISKHEKACLKVIEKIYSQLPDTFQYLRKLSLATLYEYLVAKAVEPPLDRQKGLMAARFLWNTIKNKPIFLNQIRLVISLTFKISAIVLLPSGWAHRLLATAEAMIKPSKRQGRVYR